MILANWISTLIKNVFAEGSYRMEWSKVRPTWSGFGLTKFSDPYLHFVAPYDGFFPKYMTPVPSMLIFKLFFKLINILTL